MKKFAIFFECGAFVMAVLTVPSVQTVAWGGFVVFFDMLRRSL